MKVFLKKNKLNHLEPTNIDSQNAIAKLVVGQVVTCDIKQPRNIKHHRKMFALLGLVFDNQSRYKNVNDLLTEIKLKTGHYKEHITTKGKIVYVPKSIAFENMKQLEFNEFYELAVNLCLDHFLTDTTREILDKELEGFIN